jgi:hypothetical protein
MISNTESDPTGDYLQYEARRWLSPPDPWKNHNLARKSRQSGAGTSQIEGDTYAEWKSSGPSSLYGHMETVGISLLGFFPKLMLTAAAAGAGRSVILYYKLSIIRTRRLILLASDIRKNQIANFG